MINDDYYFFLKGDKLCFNVCRINRDLRQLAKDLEIDNFADLMDYCRESSHPLGRFYFDFLCMHPNYMYKVFHSKHYRRSSNG